MGLCCCAAEAHSTTAQWLSSDSSVRGCYAAVRLQVTRDRMMLELDQQYPQYGFAQHKGYGVSSGSSRFMMQLVGEKRVDPFVVCQRQPGRRGVSFYLALWG